MTVKELIQHLQELPQDQVVEIVYNRRATDYWSSDSIEETDYFIIGNLYEKVQLDIT